MGFSVETRKEINEYVSNWRKKNPDKIKEVKGMNKMGFSVETRKEINEYVSNWRKKNPDKHMIQMHRYWEKKLQQSKETGCQVKELMGNTNMEV